jgi:hypothetical protein
MVRPRAIEAKLTRVGIGLPERGRSPTQVPSAIATLPNPGRAFLI